MTSRAAFVIATVGTLLAATGCENKADRPPAVTIDQAGKIAVSEFTKRVPGSFHIDNVSEQKVWRVDVIPEGTAKGGGATYLIDQETGRVISVVLGQ
jgi:hypothetical protein